MVERIGKAGVAASQELAPDEQERDSIAFTLDGRPVQVRRDETIWHAARPGYGATIPHGCLSSAPDFRPEGNRPTLRGGGRWLSHAAAELPDEGVGGGLGYPTDSARAVQAWRTVMELLLADATIEPLSECGRVVSAMAL